MESYDVVIVGAGSAGGALAGRLTEASDKRVLVLEGGPVYRSIEELPAVLLDPASISSSMPGHPNNWADLAEVRPGFSFPMPRGRGMGGTSSLNGGAWIRGTKEDFTDWSNAGNDQWSYDKVLPVFKRIESDKDFAGEYHGSDGPIPVRREPIDRAPELTNTFDEACNSLGFPDDPDKNAPSQGGVGAIPMNILDGRRMGTAMTHLLPAMERPNFTIIGDAVVQRVIFEGNRAVGVEALVDGKPQTFRGVEIVISLGTLRSPRLLMVSGVGPADHLNELGIPVVQDLPGVGQNLTDHVNAHPAWDSKLDMPHLPNRAVMTSALHWRDEGAVLEIIPGVARYGDLMGASDLLQRPIKAAKALRGSSVKAVTREALAMRHRMLVVTVHQVESRGSITLQSADPGDAAVIKFNMLSEEADRARLRAGMRMAYEIFRTPAFKRIDGKLVGLKSSELDDDAALDKWAMATVAAAQPTGTCKMGPRADSMAVVDQELRVHGIEGLRVADASIFPTIVSRPPNATAVMVGERLADFLA